MHRYQRYAAGRGGHHKAVYEYQIYQRACERVGEAADADIEIEQPGERRYADAETGECDVDAEIGDYQAGESERERRYAKHKQACGDYDARAVAVVQPAQEGLSERVDHRADCDNGGDFGAVVPYAVGLHLFDEDAQTVARAHRHEQREKARRDYEIPVKDGLAQ